MQKKFIPLLLIGAGFMPNMAHAIVRNAGPVRFDVSGYGSAGMIQANSQKADFLGDWRVRGQVSYDTENRSRIGLVYAIDAQTVDSDEYIDDLFAFIQSRKYGRVEIGMTDSVAGKLGLGLPDVGGMRVNGTPLFYQKINPDGPVLDDATIDSGDQLLRLNIVSPTFSGTQIGASVAGVTDKFDYATDIGAKFRRGGGKTKTAFSLGASFIDNPHGFAPDAHAPSVTARWRGQLSGGMNIQYNSIILGANIRAVYDHDAITSASDGLIAGLGASYDILNYSVSLSYINSMVGIWHSDADNYTDNTVIGSFRYKYSANVDGWTSIGLSSKTPFVAAGLRLTF